MTNICAKFNQTQDVQDMNQIENSRTRTRTRTRTRHILELKIGMDMEWKKDEWKET